MALFCFVLWQKLRHSENLKRFTSFDGGCVSIFVLSPMNRIFSAPEHLNLNDRCILLNLVYRCSTVLPQTLVTWKF